MAFLNACQVSVFFQFSMRAKNQRQHPPFQAAFSVNNRTSSLKAGHL